MENQKVKNATQCLYKGIKFKSELERDSYKLLEAEGLNPAYEKTTFQLWNGKKLSVPCYDLHKDRKLHRNVWGINSYKPVSIKYTPDFIVNIQDSSGTDRMLVIEAKGYPNDRYQYVKKLFRSYLEDNHPQSIFFEVHSLRHLKSAINIIKQLKEQ